MTVTEILLNFRAALLAVLPMVEAVGIPWRRGDAYDQWDELVSCMYKQLVADVVSTIRNPKLDAPASLAAYDMMLSDYRRQAFIEVENDVLGPGIWVFHAFGTDKTPFDVLEVRELTMDRQPRGDALSGCPLSGSRLSLRLPDGSKIASVAVQSDA